MPFKDAPAPRRVLELLSRSVAREALPPSLIFAGPERGGVRAAAIALAQAVNCLSPRAGRQGSDALPLDACGTCAACTRIARGVHPDILLVEPGDTGTIKIEPVRDIVERAAFRPFEGKRRVVIIDEADAMVPAAQNALLKTLEEPPPSSVFVLVTERPDLLLITVRSRCIRLAFHAATAIEIDEDDFALAQRVLMQAAGAGARKLDGAKDLLEGTGSGGARDRDRLAAHLQALAVLLRDIEAVSVGAVEPAHLPAARAAAAERFVNAYRGERGVQAFESVFRALTAIDRNAGVKTVADWVMLQL